MIQLLISLCAGLLFLFPVTDADLGWHLRYGDYFWQTGRLLKENVFSWQMPEYIWANHSWGYDLLVSWLYRVGGFSALSIAGAFSVALALFLVLPRKPSILLLPLSGLFFIVNFNLLNTGLKSNYISLVFTSLTYLLLRSQKKYRRFLPLIFLIWSNLHGQFSLGLALVIIFGLTHVSRFNISLCVASFGMTLLNPWGFNLWSTAFEHLSAPTVNFIYEWMPWEWQQPGMIIFFVYIVFVGLSLWRHRRHLDRFDLISIAIMSVLGLRSRRLIPIAMLISFPLMYEIFKVKLILKTGYYLVPVVGFLLFVIVTLIPNRNIFHQTWSTYCQTYLRCSVGAGDFLRTYPIKGKLFNAYSLGSYLIYHVPHIPVFIDGRMTVWKTSNLQYPFQKYYHIIHGGAGTLDLLYQQSVELVILQPQFELSAILADNHWPVLFDDQVVRIYANPFFSPESEPNPS